jgi:hypothetical protein
LRPVVYDHIRISMTFKFRFTQCLGAVAIICGCILATLLLRILIFGRVGTLWNAIGDILIAALAVYLVYVGLRAVRYGDSSRRPFPRFRWGRILLGAWIIYVNAKNHFQPSPNLLQPSNETQATAMTVTMLALSISGLALILWGFFPTRPRQNTAP